MKIYFKKVFLESLVVFVIWTIVSMGFYYLKTLINIPMNNMFVELTFNFIALFIALVLKSTISKI